MALPTLKSRRGAALVMVLMFMMVVSISFASLGSLIVSEMRAEQDNLHTTQAFYLAEAAVEVGKARLKDSWSSPSGEGTEYYLWPGEYYFTVDDVEGSSEKVITGYGAVPDFDDPDATRRVKSVVDSVPQDLPFDFTHAIWASDTIDINGSSPDVEGDIFAGNDVACSPASCPGVTGTITEVGDPGYEFPEVPWSALKDMAQSQTNEYGEDNYYTAEEIAAGDPPLPTTFWNEEPTADSDGVPNVVYIESDLELNPSDGDIGGFLVIAGASPDDPSSEATCTVLNGSMSVDGVVLVNGEYRKNGGGPGATVDGAVVGKDARLNGHSNVIYNPDYCEALQNLEIEGGGLEVTGWAEGS